MHAHDLFLGHGGQAQRVHLAQVGLLGEGQLLEIGLGLHIGKVDALELLGVEGRAILQGFELLFYQVELIFGEFHRSAFRIG